MGLFTTLLIIGRGPLSTTQSIQSSDYSSSQTLVKSPEKIQLEDDSEFPFGMNGLISRAIR